jgi:hypothetical protein
MASLLQNNVQQEDSGGRELSMSFWLQAARSVIKVKLIWQCSPTMPDPLSLNLATCHANSPHVARKQPAGRSNPRSPQVARKQPASSLPASSLQVVCKEEVEQEEEGSTRTRTRRGVGGLAGHLQATRRPPSGLQVVCKCSASGPHVVSKWSASGLQVVCEWSANGLQVAG